MNETTCNDKVYQIDSRGFLIDFNTWDEDFARWMAIGVRIAAQLTTEHWDVIRFIRGSYIKNNSCPTIYETCREVGLGVKELKRLFPTGYYRGACKLAGITYNDVPSTDPVVDNSTGKKNIKISDIEYLVDSRGYLLNPDSWDGNFASHIALKTGISLSDEHWRIIKFMRSRYSKFNDVPTIYETCERNDIDLDTLEQLFPNGYHRGAIKIAGLSIR